MEIELIDNTEIRIQKEGETTTISSCRWMKIDQLNTILKDLLKSFLTCNDTNSVFLAKPYALNYLNSINALLEVENRQYYLDKVFPYLSHKEVTTLYLLDGEYDPDTNLLIYADLRPSYIARIHSLNYFKQAVTEIEEDAKKEAEAKKKDLSL
jgi:hypothetical protein